MMKHFYQNGIPKTQVYLKIEYVETAQLVNRKKGVGTPPKRPNQTSIGYHRREKQKLPQFQLQGEMQYSSELMHRNGLFCLFILVSS